MPLDTPTLVQATIVVSGHPPIPAVSLIVNGQAMATAVSSVAHFQFLERRERDIHVRDERALRLARGSRALDRPTIGAR